MGSLKILPLLAAGFLAALLAWASVEPSPPAALVREARLAYRRNSSAVKNPRYLTLIDYTKPIFVPRLWVIDMTTGAAVLTCRVSHALSSGFIYPDELSNEEGSQKSCAGSFVTRETYQGKFGASLRVVGLDPGNSRALRRHIVLHENLLPYSRGCWMTLPATNRRLLALTKGGTFVYVASVRRLR